MFNGFAYHIRIFLSPSSESGKVSHYIINRRGGIYIIGDQTFHSIPEVIDFYTKHFLDTTTLVEIVRPNPLIHPDVRSLMLLICRHPVRRPCLRLSNQRPDPTRHYHQEGSRSRRRRIPPHQASFPLTRSYRRLVCSSRRRRRSRCRNSSP